MYLYLCFLLLMLLQIVSVMMPQYRVLVDAKDAVDLPVFEPEERPAGGAGGGATTAAAAGGAKRKAPAPTKGPKKAPKKKKN